jgi:hypothetical protein
MARNPDPKPGRWILPLVILGMVFFTWAFVNQLEAPQLDDDTPVSSTTSTTLEATPTTLNAESTTTTALPPSLQTYLDNLLGDKATLAGIDETMTAVNSDWNDRAETGKTFDEAVADLEAIAEQALIFSQSVQIHIPPSGVTGLADAHQAALDSAQDGASAADAVIDGLRAPDTGQLRQAALVEFRAAKERFDIAVDQINDIITQPAGG